MNYKLKDFAEKLKEKKTNDEFNDKSIRSDMGSYLVSLNERTTINFNLFVREGGSGLLSFGDQGQFILTLDNEDLEYFKNKYLTQIDDEYENNLLELKSKYNKL